MLTVLAIGIILLLIGVLCYSYGFQQGVEKMEHSAVSTGCGHYNAGTGRFKFGRNPAERACQKIRETAAKQIENEHADYDEQIDRLHNLQNELYDELDKKDDENAKLRTEIRGLKARTKRK